MKLTEAKLKRMILEVLGQESLDLMFAQYGFEPYDDSWITKPTKHKNYNARSWFKGQPGRRGTVQINFQYTLHDSILHYKIEGLSTRKRRGGSTFSIASGKVEMPPNLSLETEEGIREADAILLSSNNTFPSKDPNHEILSIEDTIRRALEMYSPTDPVLPIDPNSDS